MPGYEGEGKKIVKWLADNVSKDLYVRQRHLPDLSQRPSESVGIRDRSRHPILLARRDATDL